MPRPINIGAQSFETLRNNGAFYVDKTAFITEWWTLGDPVTLVCRPRRFGKTLNLDTVRCFLSTNFAGRGEELFGNLDVWSDPAMRALQGTVPVVFLSFARVKDRSLDTALAVMRAILSNAVHTHDYLAESERLSQMERDWIWRVNPDMSDGVAVDCLNQLCVLLEKHWGVSPVVLLDEYDTPMQEAWLGGYWDDMVAFQRSLFNATFKTNPSLGRALITGVTRVSRESIFSDLNNLVVVTTSTPLYQTSFGFTEDEVFAALDEYGRGGYRQEVRHWYDGFVFDGVADIYNPWSITQFLRYGAFDAYWANTSGNGLISSILQSSDREVKLDFETLLSGGAIEKIIDEQIVFSELRRRKNAVWALMLASGYLKAPDPTPTNLIESPRRLEITNHEVEVTFDSMVEGWFGDAGNSYGDFVTALLANDVRAMNRFLKDVLRACASSFDGGKNASDYSEPERFYHGLVLGLLVELRGRYALESNRESGFGRYDVMLTPNDGAAGTDPAVVIEFKVFDDYDEQTLEDTVARAHAQIEEKAYVTALIERGIAPERIHTYGMAFRGKECLVG